VGECLLQFFSLGKSFFPSCVLVPTVCLIVTYSSLSHYLTVVCCRLVDIVVAVMGDVFPELKKNQAKIKEIISEEETSFSRTLVKVNGYCMLSFAGTK
jgi:hypothetical protein